MYKHIHIYIYTYIYLLLLLLLGSGKGGVLDPGVQPGKSSKQESRGSQETMESGDLRKQENKKSGIHGNQESGKQDIRKSGKQGNRTPGRRGVGGARLIGVRASPPSPRLSSSQLRSYPLPSACRPFAGGPEAAPAQRSGYSIQLGT